MDNCKKYDWQELNASFVEGARSTEKKNVSSSIKSFEPLFVQSRSTNPHDQFAPIQEQSIQLKTLTDRESEHVQERLYSESELQEILETQKQQLVAAWQEKNMKFEEYTKKDFSAQTLYLQKQLIELSGVWTGELSKQVLLFTEQLIQRVFKHYKYTHEDWLSLCEILIKQVPPKIHTIELLVHPDQLNILQSLIEQPLFADFHIELLPDPDLPFGNIRLKYEFGVLYSSFENLFDQILDQAQKIQVQPQS